MKQIDNPKTILHFKNKDYVYRYVLVDRFKHTSTTHYGFDKDLERTEAEIFASIYHRTLRRLWLISLLIQI
jgi:hypothetical protein